MRKLAAFLAVFLFIAPAWALDLIDMKAVEATSVTLSTSQASTASPFITKGDYLRMTCTVECWVAVMASTGATLMGASPYYHLHADTEVVTAVPGQRYVIGIAGGAGVLYITRLSP